MKLLSDCAPNIWTTWDGNQSHLPPYLHIITFLLHLPHLLAVFPLSGLRTEGHYSPNQGNHFQNCFKKPLSRAHVWAQPFPDILLMSNPVRSMPSQISAPVFHLFKSLILAAGRHHKLPPGEVWAQIVEAFLGYWRKTSQKWHLHGTTVSNPRIPLHQNFCLHFLSLVAATAPWISFFACRISSLNWIFRL